MKLTQLTLTFAALTLGGSLLHADIKRTEVTKKGDWTVNTCKNQAGKFIGSEMMRTYDGKYEVHLRVSFDGEKFNIDSTADWGKIPDAKFHAAEYRTDNPAGAAYWKGMASVVEDADGLTWLRISEPNEPGVGDALANSNKLFIKVGRGAKAVQWVFDLKGSNRAYKAMVENYSKNADAAHSGSTAKPAAKRPAGALDQEIQAATEELADLQTARRMMTRGAADGTPDTKKIDAQIKTATDRLEDLETARRMIGRGNAR